VNKEARFKHYGLIERCPFFIGAEHANKVFLSAFCDMEICRERIPKSIDQRIKIRQCGCPSNSVAAPHFTLFLYSVFMFLSGVTCRVHPLCLADFWSTSFHLGGRQNASDRGGVPERRR